MSKLFLHLLNISITAGWIVLVVVLLRFVLKKAPKWTRVVLWGLVALRLILPVSIESPLSLVPSEQTVSIATWTLPDTAVGTSEEGSAAQRTTAERVVFQTGFPALNSAINPTMKQSYEHHSTVSTVKVVAGWVWLAGVVGMLFYALISFLRLKHRVRASVLLEKGVYVCDEISDPFILGLIVPKIYLPSGMDEQTRAYVLAHERAHLKRFDHIWKPLGFLLLSVYWFNPLLWLAYILLCRDIELACDEKVVKELDDAGKAAYSEALVTASVSRRSIAACPLAFGETGVKSRVKSVLNYKKPAFWIILVAILACVAVAVCFLTMPKKNQPDAAEIVGTWEFYKQIVDTYETDWPIQEMLGARRDVLIFRENGTGTELYIRDDATCENPFTYTVSGNKVSITRNGRDRVPVEFTYDPESSMLRSPEDAGEGLRWYTLYVREGSISYPTVQLTNEQIAGEWKTDGLPVMEGMPLTLSGNLVFDANGTAVLHLNGDNHTEMTVNGTYDTESSVIRFEPEDDTAVLEYYPWNDQSMLFHLSIKDFKPEYQNTALASYDPQTDTIRFVVLHFGVLTFHRSIPATAMPVVQWFDYYNDFEGFSWDSTKEITVAAFPGVTFRWTAGSVEAVENGTARTLFSGMPVLNVYFTDMTGDDKPELCATVVFGSGMIDEHIVVYDYVNKQSYTLWDRGTFDYHLYTVDGALLVGKMPYMGDKQVDYGTLVMQDGVPCCLWQSDGSFTPLYRELHESELIGEWLVAEERDANDNVLYTSGLDLWKEYHFKDDGIVTYNETVPVSSNSELAFGHPVEYRYAVYDNHVHIEDGRSCYGYFDPLTHTLMLIYQTSPNQFVYATLRRMGEGTQGETTLDEATLCTIWRLAEIEAPDGSNGDARALGLEQYLVFRSDGTVRMLDMKESSDRTVPYTLNGNTVRFDDRVLRYDSALNELLWIDPSTQDVLSYAPAPNAVLPESTAESAAANMLFDLRARYPEFFDLPTENGLSVYVYQMAPRDFHFGLLPGTERQDNRDMSYLCKASLDEMKLILSDYPITPDRIEIHAARNDLSSYHYEINAAYLTQIRTLLFGEIDAGLFRDQTVEELILGIYTCCGAMDHGSFIPVPDAFVGMQIDLNDSIVLPDVDWQKEYFHFAAVTIGGTVKTGYDWNVDGNNVLTVQNEETKDTWTMYWSPSAHMLYMNANDDLSGKSVVLIFKCDD